MNPKGNGTQLNYTLNVPPQKEIEQEKKELCAHHTRATSLARWLGAIKASPNHSAADLRVIDPIQGKEKRRASQTLRRPVLREVAHGLFFQLKESRVCVCVFFELIHTHAQGLPRQALKTPHNGRGDPGARRQQEGQPSTCEYARAWILCLSSNVSLTKVQKHKTNPVFDCCLKSQHTQGHFSERGDKSASRS